MPVDLHRNIAFIHIPKTGGTTIERLFGMTTPLHLFSRTPGCQWRPSDKNPQHFTLRELRDNVPAGFLENAFIFTFVRNPWDRFLSEYMWRRHRDLQPAMLHTRRFYKPSHLDTLESFTQVLSLSADEHRHAQLGFDGHLDTQCSFLSDERIPVAFVGRYERFEADVRQVASRLNVSVESIPVLRQSRHDRTYREHYSAYARDAIAEFYRDDIAAFQYEF